jgi:UDP-GlcNAc:undecaprenyl-phosphate GlcNAc-1-phosphate transferase
VKSSKSQTGAKLLGGLGISFGIIASCLYLVLSNQIFLPEETNLILPFVISAILITIYGYIDDKYEIRARHKILFQFVSVSSLTFFAVSFLGEKNIVAAYAIVTIIGFLLLNGTNLLDGLDTLAIKLSIVSSLAFLYIGHEAESSLTVLISIMTVSCLFAFYFYNRSPAKIYLGEIGGSIIGLVFTTQTILCYQHLRTSELAISAMSLVLIALSLPICELGISFLRRIYYGKSPFIGDKLHLHYVIKTKTQFTANQVTNIMAIVNLSIMTIAFYLAKKYSSIGAIIFVNMTYVSIYVGYCKSEWKKCLDSTSSNEILSNLNGKAIYLINSADLDQVAFTKSSQNRKSA